MKLPILHQIHLTDYSKESIEQSLLKNYVGSIPLYIDIVEKNEEEIEEILQIIRNFLDEKGVHPKLPYPLFIRCDFIEEFEDLAVIKSPTELPAHFKKKIKRLKNREQVLLNKANITLQKILNQSINEDHFFINLQAEQQRELKELICESSFYEDLTQKLKQRAEK